MTKEAWLQGVPFYIDERAIVPRSFIAELLVDGSIDYWLGEHTRQVLDLCTGNGSLAVLAAMAYPDVAVTGADISAPALEVAAINVTRHALDGRIRLVESDGLAALPGPWDLILCNPPYVNSGSMAASKLRGIEHQSVLTAHICTPIDASDRLDSKRVVGDFCMITFLFTGFSFSI